MTMPSQALGTTKAPNGGSRYAPILVVTTDKEVVSHGIGKTRLAMAIVCY